MPLFEALSASYEREDIMPHAFARPARAASRSFGTVEAQRSTPALLGVVGD